LNLIIFFYNIFYIEHQPKNRHLLEIVITLDKAKNK
jgi:hypothetical protein